MVLLVLYLVLAVGVSFFCSILEAVLLSVTPSYIASLEQRSPKRGARLQRLKQNVDQPLAAILSLNTIAHTIGAAGVGAQAQVVFGKAYVSLTSAVLTLLILVLSEIIPKTIGATYWRQLAPPAPPVLGMMIAVLYPLVWLSKMLTQVFSRRGKAGLVRREELTALADLGADEGVFENRESQILKNLIRLGSLRARDIMTPRTVAVAFHERTSVDTVARDKQSLRFSRFPVFSRDEHQLSGYVLKNDILLAAAEGRGEQSLRELRRDLVVLPDLVRVDALFETMLQRGEHIVGLINEYGGFSGVVTMEDVVETLLGSEITDEVDETTDLQGLARKRWRERARRLGIIGESGTSS
ncbi:MAG: CNNM domain-containing protein [Spirochaetia bacterium]